MGKDKMKSGTLVLVLILAEMESAGWAWAQQSEGRMSCKVAKVATSPTIDANWEKAPWRAIEPQLIGRYVGEKPRHCPKTQVKIAYDDAALYVIFRVEDQYVRAVETEHNGNVCRDSCVEFFFTPGRDPRRGYFNLEMNCGGTLLFRYQDAPRKNCVHLPANECSAIQIAHSLPEIVDPEIREPVTWTVEYRLPVAILDRYCKVDKPAPGVLWRANFYKCADRTSHPHWLTWSPIDVSPPDFHRPEYFGTLKFQ